MSKKAKITVDPAYKVGKIEKRLFSAFLEPIDDWVYGGIYNLSENARVFKHGMNRSIYTAGSLLLFLRLCIIIPTKDDVGGIHRK